MEIFKLTKHGDGTVSIRIPASSLQGRGPGVDTIVHGLRQAQYGHEERGYRAANIQDRELSLRIAAEHEKLHTLITRALDDRLVSAERLAR